LETITFSDDTLSDINVVLCYVLSQYHMIQGYHVGLAFKAYCRLNMELDLQSLFGLLCTAVLIG
jgi:hypothetical protein